MRSTDPCEVGDHYSCERSRCRCTCHPRSGWPRRKKADPDNPTQTDLRGASWRPGQDAA